MIRLTVPGTLEYRDVAMRVVTAAAKLVEPGPEADEFDAHVMSAFGEAFNNIAIHGYADKSGEVEVEIDVERDRIVLRIFDRGRSFDPMEIPPPELESLPERGMGLFIIKSFVDEATYTPGDPNRLVLVKLRGAALASADEGERKEHVSPDPKQRTASGVRARGSRHTASSRPQTRRQAPLKYGTGRK